MYIQRCLDVKVDKNKPPNVNIASDKPPVVGIASGKSAKLSVANQKSLGINVTKGQLPNMNVGGRFTYLIRSHLVCLLAVSQPPVFCLMIDTYLNKHT